MINQRSRWNKSDIVVVIDAAGQPTRKPYLNLLDREVIAYPDDIPYQCKPKDTFSSLAYRAAGDSYLWWIIAEANGVVDPWEDLLRFQEEDITLRIPSVNTMNFSYLDFEP